MKNDEYFMREAIRLAKIAESEDEVPVGALIVREVKMRNASCRASCD